MASPLYEDGRYRLSVQPMGSHRKRVLFIVFCSAVHFTSSQSSCHCKRCALCLACLSDRGSPSTANADWGSSSECCEQHGEPCVFPISGAIGRASSWCAALRLNRKYSTEHVQACSQCPTKHQLSACCAKWWTLEALCRLLVLCEVARRLAAPQGDGARLAHPARAGELPCYRRLSPPGLPLPLTLVLPWHRCFRQPH